MKRFPMTRPLLAALAILPFVVLPLAIQAAPPVSSPLPPDVPARHWAAGSVGRVEHEKIMGRDPDGRFHGDKPVTRYELAVTLDPLRPLPGSGAQTPPCGAAASFSYLARQSLPGGAAGSDSPDFQRLPAAPVPPGRPQWSCASHRPGTRRRPRLRHHSPFRPRGSAAKTVS